MPISPCSLVGPDATIVNLSVENGGSANNYGSACTPLTSRTTFDDSAANYIAHGSAPFVGSFRPEQPLSAFNGKSGAAANGTWKLRIVDSVRRRYRNAAVLVAQHQRRQSRRPPA